MLFLKKDRDAGAAGGKEEIESEYFEKSVKNAGNDPSN